MTAEIRRLLVAMAGGPAGVLDCVPIQGSGTFAVEAMLGSFLPRDGKALVLMNGAYGQRIGQTLDYLGRAYTAIDKGDYIPPRGEEVAAALDGDGAISHVVAVHCETSSGILNPIEEIAEVVQNKGRKLLLDSMSAFGGLAVDASKLKYEAMVSSANKCIEGVPGFGFVIAPKGAIEAAKGRSHSLSLDVYAQWDCLEKTGQWRFTPPTHVVAAFLSALMKQRGFIIYPGKLTVVESFPVGCIGRLDAPVMRGVVKAARESLDEMGVNSAAPPGAALEERHKLTA